MTGTFLDAMSAVFNSFESLSAGEMHGNGNDILAVLLQAFELKRVPALTQAAKHSTALHPMLFRKTRYEVVFLSSN